MAEEWNYLNGVNDEFSAKEHRISVPNVPKYADFRGKSFFLGKSFFRGNANAIINLLSQKSIIQNFIKN